MTRDEIEKGIVEALSNIGIFVEPNEAFTVPIDEVLPDSLTFISFIVELEQLFKLEISDEYLYPERLSSIENIANVIEDLLSTSSTTEN